MKFADGPTEPTNLVCLELSDRKTRPYHLSSSVHCFVSLYISQVVIRQIYGFYNWSKVLLVFGLPL